MSAASPAFATSIVFLAAFAMAAEDRKPEGHPEDNPGPIHKFLAARAGEYTVASTMRVKPDDPPMESKGTAKIAALRPAHGRRWACR